MAQTRAVSGGPDKSTREHGLQRQKQKYGKTYYLHSRRQALKGGHVQTLYFFAAQEKEGAIDSMPDGFVIYENDKTGTLFLKKR